MTGDLFTTPFEPLADGAAVLRCFVTKVSASLIGAVEGVIAAAPLRHMVTPGGRRMSVAMTNCGEVGWVSDQKGYRYSPIDPATGRNWPPMPPSFRKAAETAAAEAGFPLFAPDACLINRYEIGARLTLHQDKDERDFKQPIV